MSDPRISRLATTLIHYCVAVRPDDWVLIRADIDALPLVEEVYRAVLLAGGNPTVQWDAGELPETLLRLGTDRQLGWVAPTDQLLADQVDCRIRLTAPRNSRMLSGVEPARQQMLGKAQGALSRTYMQRAATGAHRWVIADFPCQSLAQDADMSLRDYEDFVYGATFADDPEPVARWLELRTEQQRLVDWLKGRKQVTVKGPHIDLRLSIEGRTFINSDGRRNMPSGEIFTGPVEESAEGWVHFTYPAVRGGREVENVEFVFAQGKVVHAAAGKNEAYLLSQLDSDPGARYLGEFAIGTNYRIQRFTRNILFDEKIGGTLHMAVGAGYPETGSRNQSAIHWDFICDMREESEIRVDGELFYRNGRVLV